MFGRRSRSTTHVAFCERCDEVCDPTCRARTFEDDRRLLAATIRAGHTWGF